MSKWISVHNRLPKAETAVLIAHKDGIRTGEIRWDHPTHEEDYQSFRYWDDPYDDGKDWEWSDVTHWMPLPEPPK
jgi:Protein of unknown function (DUF551)